MHNAQIAVNDAWPALHNTHTRDDTCVLHTEADRYYLQTDLSLAEKLICIHVSGALSNTPHE